MMPKTISTIEIQAERENLTIEMFKASFKMLLSKNNDPQIMDFADEMAMMFFLGMRISIGTAFSEDEHSKILEILTEINGQAIAHLQKLGMDLGIATDMGTAKRNAEEMIRKKKEELAERREKASVKDLMDCLAPDKGTTLH